MLNKIKDNLSLIFTVLLICIVFWFGRSCGKQINKPIEPKIITITNYKDTIYPKDTIISFKDKPIPYPVYIDTHKYKPLPIDSLEINRFFNYKDSIENKDITLYYDINTQGKTLKSFSPSYKLHVPLIIKDCTIVKKDSIIYKPNRWDIKVGILAGVKTLAPSIDYTKNKTTFMLAYDPFNKIPYIGIKYTIFKSKK